MTGREELRSRVRATLSHHRAGRFLLGIRRAWIDTADGEYLQSRVKYVEASLTPTEVLRSNFRTVTEILSMAGVEWWVLSESDDRRTRIGVWDDDRSRAIRALSSATESNLYVRVPDVQGDTPADRAFGRESTAKADQLVLFVPIAVPSSNRRYLGEGSCELEFWRRTRIGGVDYCEGPAENRASRLLSAEDFTLVDKDLWGQNVKIPAALTKRMLDDVTFPIDMVYTWVDGNDPAWREKRGREQARREGIEFHPEAVMESRFISRDELRYSLRSVHSYAPWVRNIYIVTDSQVPPWLDVEHPKIRVVDHREIFDDERQLPNFNSNAIISRLHHIEGLSEHYIYMNDDVFLGRWTTPATFFTPSGHAKVSPSNNRRPFGPSGVESEPHFNLTHNIRRIVEDRFGITISRAIKHTPHPQIRSLHFELEEMFRDEYRLTLGHWFRHHSDIVADQLHHYVAQILGKAVPTKIRYDYINVMDGSHKVRLQNLLENRDRDTFCLNDAPVPGETPISEEYLSEFLTGYFPIRSPFELPGQ